jgi:hypothetical protein
MTAIPLHPGARVILSDEDVQVVFPVEMRAGFEPGDPGAGMLALAQRLHTLSVQLELLSMGYRRRP